MCERDEYLWDMRVCMYVMCSCVCVCMCTNVHAHRAIALHEEGKAISTALGDQAGVGLACCNLAICYKGLGQYERAIALSLEGNSIAEAVRDKAGQAETHLVLGSCYLSTGELAKAVTAYQAASRLFRELKQWQNLSECALKLGVAFRLQAQADRRSSSGLPSSGEDLERGMPASGDDLDRKMKAASVNFILANAGGHTYAMLHQARTHSEKSSLLWVYMSKYIRVLTFQNLHQAHLAFDVGQEEKALAHLKEFLTWRVEHGRTFCDGCGQKRCEDTAPMLTCNGCKVARFCNADHQKMASKSIASGGNIFMGRHKDLCGVVGKWRRVVKDGESADSCTADLLAFLQKYS